MHFRLISIDICLLDGVAPRAKMNQQRSRRFRASQLAQIEQEAADRVSKELEGKKKSDDSVHNIYIISLLIAIGQVHQLPEKKEHFDSNCITPGTPFMAHLATCLRYHIAAKQNSDPLWKNVILIKNCFWENEQMLTPFLIL